MKICYPEAFRLKDLVFSWVDVQVRWGVLREDHVPDFPIFFYSSRDILFSTELVLVENDYQPRSGFPVPHPLTIQILKYIDYIHNLNFNMKFEKQARFYIVEPTTIFNLYPRKIEKHHWWLIFPGIHGKELTYSTKKTRFDIFSLRFSVQMCSPKFFSSKKFSE